MLRKIMAESNPANFKRLREQADQLSRTTSHQLPKLTPQSVETLVHQLRVHQVELELQCQELLQAQEEAEESRNRYRELYEAIPIGYVTIDGAGRIYDLNPAGASLLGTRAECRLPNFFSFFADGDAEAVHLVRRVLSNKHAEAHDLKMKSIQETNFLVSVHAAPVHIGEGKGERVRIAFKDITHRKQVEESLREHQVELENNRVELQELMAKLFTAQEEERRRIACDLHDDHCQRITALILEASALEKLVKPLMPSILPRMAIFKQKLGDILDDFRHLTHELHPRHLDTVSLACSMRTHVKEFIEYSELQVEFTEFDMPAHLPMPITICLYRLLQESLSNIRKHAKATHVTIQLSGGKQEVELLVSDDGTGFKCADNKKGLGLTSMQERVRPLRGRVAIDSKPGVGTCVSVRIPLTSES